MQETICAKVNLRLLSKADRLFTGSIEGRIIEVLQNARRAGASEVRISNKDGLVTVADNGSGIEDFHKLLDLGGSGWDEKLEAGEDPAGVGLFSLAPREVTITSGSKQVVIGPDGWTGKPVEIEAARESVNGTVLKFRDEKPWGLDLLEKHAVFSSIRVIVDGKICHSMPFCGKDAVTITDIGCRIEVVKEVSKYHQMWKSGWGNGKVLLNFHGQVVQVDCWPGNNNTNLMILVDLDQQTDIRLMLPARTRLVENIAYERLKRFIEKQYYEYFKQQGSHKLYFSQWQRARQLGIVLPEAEPCYSVGLIHDEYEMAVDVVEPKDFELKDGYLCNYKDDIDESVLVNAHLLAAQGSFQGKSFVPVTIKSDYLGYSWAKLPKVTDARVDYGKELLRYGIGSGEIACFDKLTISIKTSDGKSFSSDVDLAIISHPQEDKRGWIDETVAVTKDARVNLSMENIWYHFGGFNVEGDCYETQQYYFEKDIDEFWNELVGPYENFRENIQLLINRQNRLYDKWQSVSFGCDGVLTIVFKDGKTETVNPVK